MLGQDQLDWLKQALCSSEATFKIIAIGGQFLNSAANFETYSNFQFEKERNDIITFIQNQGIKGVLFLTGDRHFSELSLLKEDNKPAIYDLTTSPLTSSPSKSYADDKNKYRVDGTLVTVRNFATLNFSGKEQDRNMTIRVFNSEGKELWNKKINQNQF
jgi:alkaline phosphatase D